MADVEVWWARPDASAGQLDLLDAAERERHERFLRAADRARFRTARAVAKTVLARRLGIAAAAIRFDVTCPGCGEQHGKPRLPGVDVELSISHSGDRIVVAVTSAAPVGVDVEAVPAKPVDDGMLDATLSPRERLAVRALPARARTAAFIAYWTRKEALLKATGEGLTTPMNGITVSPPDGAPRLLDPGTSKADPAAVRMVDLAVGGNIGKDSAGDYRACLAVLDGGELTVTTHDAAVLF